MRRLTSLAADASCGCARNLMRHEQAHRRASETVGLLAMPVTVKLRRPGMTEVGPLLPRTTESVANLCQMTSDGPESRWCRLVILCKEEHDHASP